MTGSSIPFLITIDTEGDNLWSRQQKITTRNAAYLPRFQTLCEKYGLKPTYLTNYEMVIDDAFVSFAREAQDSGWAEVGMHLHAWHSPPHKHTLTNDDYHYHPYLIEYPANVLRDKIAYMTELLTEKFGRRPTSHRAGRWALDCRYIGALIDQGYLVDCSVTPHISWRSNKGVPNGAGGTDYRCFPDSCYFIDPERIDKPGVSPLLEIPMTITPRRPFITRLIPETVDRVSLLSRALKKIHPIDWFRPTRTNARQMKSLLHKMQQGKREYIQFMIHSSELMPGGSPYFPDNGSVEKLYDDLGAVFELVARNFRGMTLTEFYRAHRAVQEQQ